MPNYYRSSATLLVQEESGGSTMSALLSALGMGSGPESGSLNAGQTAITVLRSRSFIDETIDKLNIIELYEIEERVRTTSREIMLAKSSFNFDRTQSLLTISFEDTDPEFAYEGVVVMVEQLQEWFTTKGGTDKVKQLKSLEKKLIEVEAEIARLEQEIEDFQQTHGVLSVSEIAEMQNSILRDLRTQLVEKELEIMNYQEISKIENDPVLIRLQAERNNIANTISQIENGYMGNNRKLPAQEELPQLSLEFGRLQMDLEIQQRIYQALAEQYEVTKLSVEEEQLFTMLEPPEIPEEKAGPMRSRLCMMVALASFFGSVILALAIHTIKNIVNDPKKRRILQKEDQ